MLVIHIYLATGFVCLAVAVVNTLVETTVIGRVLVRKCMYVLFRTPRACSPCNPYSPPHN